MRSLTQSGISGAQSEFSASLRKLLRGFGEGVVEVVGMLAVGDVDGHFTGEADQLAGAGIRDDGDRKLKSAAVHGAGVL